MKALTICQPYAELIALGEKRVENRTWPTKHRGPLAIHAGRNRSWIRSYTGVLPSGLVFGAVIATAELVECVKAITREDIEKWLARQEPEQAQRFSWLPSHRHCHGPYLWIFENVQRLSEPVPARGSQTLWDWKYD